MQNKLLIYFWIAIVFIISCTNSNQEDIADIQTTINQLSERINNKTKEFSSYKSKITIDIDEIKDLNKINQNIIKNFPVNKLEDLVHGITTPSDLEELIQNHESELEKITAKLPKIIERIMELNTKLDTWNGSPNEIFNEFDKILDFIPISLLSIFIFFIALKIIVAGYVNRRDDSQDKVKLVESEARQANDNPPIATLDYESPIQHPEQKYLNLTIDRKPESGKKSKNAKDSKKFSSKRSTEVHNNNSINSQQPIFFGFSNNAYE